jgi:hypothetical protein
MQESDPARPLDPMGGTLRPTKGSVKSRKAPVKDLPSYEGTYFGETGI